MLVVLAVGCGGWRLACFGESVCFFFCCRFWCAVCGFFVLLVFCGFGLLCFGCLSGLGFVVCSLFGFCFCLGFWVYLVFFVVLALFILVFLSVFWFFVLLFVGVAVSFVWLWVGVLFVCFSFVCFLCG